MTIQAIITKIQTGILNPLIGMLFVLAFVIFLWGVIRYVIAVQGDPKKLEQGKQTMIWGIIGMAIMAAAWSIVGILCTTFGVECRGSFGAEIRRSIDSAWL